MKEPNISSVIGPVMVGPSSSHTAGAVKLGLLAKAIYGKQPRTVDIYLHGSFRKVGFGHGTYGALTAGLLIPGCTISDKRIPEAIRLVKQMDIAVRLHDDADIGEGYHPNTARFVLDAEGEIMSITGSSIGGGRVVIVEIDDFKRLEDMNITGEDYSFVIFCDDRVGLIADISRVISDSGYNINYAGYHRENGKSLLVVTLDKPTSPEVLQRIKGIKNIRRIVVIEKIT